MTVFEYQITQEPDYIFVRVKGKALSDDILAMYNQVVTLASEHQVNCLLIDVVELQLDLKGVNMVELMYRLKAKIQGLKIARIINYQDYKNGLIEVYTEQENIAAKNFDNEQDAIKWLLS